MAVAYSAVASGANGTGGSTSLSFSHTCGASDNYITMGIALRPDVTNLTCTYNSVSATLIGSKLTGGDNLEFCYVFGLANPTTGTNTVAFSWTTTSRAAGGSISFTGANGGAGTPTTGASSSTNDLSITASPGPGANDLLVGFGAVDENASNISVSAGTSRFVRAGPDTNYICLAGATNTTSVITFHSTTTTIGWTGVVVPILATTPNTTNFFQLM